MHDAVERGDRLAFRRAYDSCILDIRQVYFTMLKEGAGISGFDEWFGPEAERLKGDALWRFLVAERNRIEKEGKDSLEHGTQMQGGFEMGPPPFPDARLVIKDGFWWVRDLGGPKEEWIAHQPKGAGTYVEIVKVANPPDSHLGTRLERTDPISLCGVALETLEGLVHEGRCRFAQK